MSDAEADVTDGRSKVDSRCEGGPSEAQFTPEMLASLEKMTNITRSCARQLRAINEAMERCVSFGKCLQCRV